SVLEKYIGGKGLGAYLLHQYVDPKIDPLSDKNPIIIATGPAQGTVPIAGRYSIITKSPHTGIFLDSHVGGYVGPELKFAGFDAIMILGKSEHPVYIEITNQSVHIKNADHLWGLSSLNAEDQIKENHDAKAKVIVIGPAGENLVHISTATSDYYRTAARGGIGMLFGSKKLKGISIRGTLELDVPDIGSLKELRKDINHRTKKSIDNGHLLPKIGSSWLLRIANERDQLPTLNYQYGEFEAFEKITGESLHEKFSSVTKRKPCYRCPLGCSYIINYEAEWTEGRMVQHPEYESIGLLGSNLGIDCLDHILQTNHTCNSLGLDTISTGSVISWFMEVGNKGLIPEKYKHEKIEFGDKSGIIQLISKIANQEGVGEILSQGVKRASEIFGNGTDRYAVHVKGLELPAWDPRGKLGLGLSYITSNVGGSHLRGWPATVDPPDRSMVPYIDSLIEQQDLKILKDSLIMCHFTHSIAPGLGISDTAKIFEVTTGVKTSVKEMREKAQRIWIASRLFNVKIWGEISPRQLGVLPHRLMYDPLPTGKAKGMTSFNNQQDLDESLTIFYNKRGCDFDGRPQYQEITNL
ncbi:MAG: aldehyde ferredoxin oxidoreductase family protein, partial [Candidatus Heimdallarchaeota archaeon]|nr:aldehyde ferredoxin oxidoreductase family protein [Candidatus Heimdallarchaeota archaeon]